MKAMPYPIFNPDDPKNACFVVEDIADIMTIETRTLKELNEEVRKAIGVYSANACHLVDAKQNIQFTDKKGKIRKFPYSMTLIFGTYRRVYLDEIDSTSPNDEYEPERDGIPF